MNNGSQGQLRAGIRGHWDGYWGHWDRCGGNGALRCTEVDNGDTGATLGPGVVPGGPHALVLLLWDRPSQPPLRRVAAAEE